MITPNQKILKTLNSSGQVLDSSREVIADTSDYWLRFYEQAEPKPDKILHSDGTITDSDDNLIQEITQKILNCGKSKG